MKRITRALEPLNVAVSGALFGMRAYSENCRFYSLIFRLNVPSL